MTKRNRNKKKHDKKKNIEENVSSPDYNSESCHDDVLPLSLSDDYDTKQSSNSQSEEYVIQNLLLNDSDAELELHYSSPKDDKFNALDSELKSELKSELQSELEQDIHKTILELIDNCISKNINNEKFTNKLEDDQDYDDNNINNNINNNGELQNNVNAESDNIKVENNEDITEEQMINDKIEIVNNIVDTEVNNSGNSKTEIQLNTEIKSNTVPIKTTSYFSNMLSFFRLI